MFTLLIGGDYKFVLHIAMDKMGGLMKTHNKMCNYLNEWMATNDVKDIWRTEHDVERKFTWVSIIKPRVYCRLD